MISKTCLYDRGKRTRPSKFVSEKILTRSILLKRSEICRSKHHRTYFSEIIVKLIMNLLTQFASSHETFNNRPWPASVLCYVFRKQSDVLCQLLAISNVKFKSCGYFDIEIAWYFLAFPSKNFSLFHLDMLYHLPSVANHGIERFLRLAS